ncbi:MAG: serine hydrolase [Gemmatimonadaceae bacterium]
MPTRPHCLDTCCQRFPALLLALVSLGCAHRISEAKPSTSTAAQRLDAYVAPLIATHEFSGSVLVRRGRDTLAARSYGMANREFAVPTDMDTRYLIGSISKQFTAAAILALEGQGRLSLDDRLSRFIPNFPSGDSITLRQMLVHRSGISRDITDIRDNALPHSAAELAEIIRQLPLSFAPGTQDGYSNNAYRVLAFVIERTSGQSYEQYLRQTLFAPLGMTHTGEVASLLLIPRLASGYSPGFGADGFAPAAYVDITNSRGSGSLYSTVGDLDIWITRFLRDGAILPAVRDKMLAGDGIGVGVRTVQGRRVIGHDGVYQGYTGFIKFFPAEDLAVIYLGNTETAASENSFQSALQAIALGEAVPPFPLRARGATAPTLPLDDYVGRFNFFPGFTVTIRRMGSYAVLTAGQGDSPLEWLGRDTAFFRLKYADIRFQRGSDGRVTGLEWLEAGHTYPAKRVD